MDLAPYHVHMTTDTVSTPGAPSLPRYTRSHTTGLKIRLYGEVLKYADDTIIFVTVCERNNFLLNPQGMLRDNL